MWKPNVQPNDPIAHLMQDLYLLGTVLNDQFQILQFNEPPINLLEMPYQYLARTVMETAARSRTKAAEGTKAKNSQLEEIDAIASTASHKKLDDKDCSFLQTHQCGGGWSTEKLKETGISEDCKCHHCGLIHSGNNLIWECKHPQLEEIRFQTDPELAAIDIKHIPDLIRRGIAPAMHIQQTTCWGDQITDIIFLHSQH